ncbi:thioredoxin domain-containing protein [Thermomicrobiaceae bacterium CFH 74404]|uniref:Thioredoxin domain-containing protein n=1 Tax=Thermalbibacter longus TaxID=2951981 RepID=A0AA41WEA7_9BACT|nr:thioredoxin domain-containing protein [Thermalbibacter longus]MCM8748445.1 thioredoxin domain-containing protein [Thermalbibacter longus]
MPNRLQHETSPYLLQHADNPVDWYPWGEEAFRVAREQDKPILLSIGYSACHWCHVMEHESFENPEIAHLMNELFINIKVDREERPDLDELYMSAVQVLTGHGGWPLTVFLTPDGKPFYGGTYFPPEDRGQMPGFPRVLLAVAEAYHQRRDEVERASSELVKHLEQQFRLPLEPTSLQPSLLDEAARNLVPHFDREHGGFGGAPKFPSPMPLEFLLRTFKRTGAPRALEMVTITLDRMARGGIYDQIGGGFHRYAVDAVWLVPHFEKMLYDNALLSRVYLLAYQASGNPFFRRIAEETIDYVLREMTSPEGGFYATQDADSEGEEGKFYLWTPEEIEDVLGSEQARVVMRYFGVRPGGNFEGKSILYIPHDPRQVAAELGLELDELERAIADARRKLYDARARRVWPGRDEKVIVSWNGLMLRAMAEAASVLGREDYAAAAVRNAEFLSSTVARDGHLFHVYKDGRAKIEGMLEDYAYLINGLVSLYEATFEARWIAWARELAETMLAEFSDPEQGDFFDTSVRSEALVARPKGLFDSATPSGNGAAAEALLRLSLLLGETRYQQRATAILERYARLASEHPVGFGQFLIAIDFALGQPFEVALVGEPSAPDTRALLRVVREPYQPYKVVALRQPGDEQAAEIVPLLAHRTMVDSRATAYVCRNFACQQPVTEPEALAEQLGVAVP